MLAVRSFICFRIGLLYFALLYLLFPLMCPCGGKTVRRPTRCGARAEDPQGGIQGYDGAGWVGLPFFFFFFLISGPGPLFILFALGLWPCFFFFFFLG